jgi:hypothetical protein
MNTKVKALLFLAFLSFSKAFSENLKEKYEKAWWSRFFQPTS